MFWKLLVAMGVLAVIGAALLGLRAQRQQLRHQITELHTEIDASRRQTWDLQVRIAEHTEPADLRSAVERAGLELEPVTPPLRPGVSRRGRMAEAEYGR
ncbi:MAG: hypothetical protein ACODAQ_04100 [Phycisphaeraceae bacterium]